VVCSEFDIFEKLDERNQGWIDGGLFAMTLVYALHSLGLGSCMLNWSVSNARDASFRAAFGVPENQGVICMIAVGHLRDSFRVAQSPRRPVEDLKHPLIFQKMD
jgi:nitroreductase